ncbi:MAG: hypothetical protein NTV34_08580 [Proteobacteria bacterium]|nr:hypothetical protein [Pseudomonadota bacterium]
MQWKEFVKLCDVRKLKATGAFDSLLEFRGDIHNTAQVVTTLTAKSLAQSIELDKAEEFEWIVQDENTLIFKIWGFSSKYCCFLECLNIRSGDVSSAVLS